MKDMILISRWGRNLLAGESRRAVLEELGGLIISRRYHDPGKGSGKGLGG
jgi:hypothetical protein